MIGVELLDDPRADPGAVERELRDIARLNALFGGTRAVVGSLEPFFARWKSEQAGDKTRTWTLLDVGTGLGDIPRAAARAAARHGLRLRLIGIELNRAALHVARAGPTDPALAAILADGGAPPFGSRAVDIVVVSQVLHHLPRAVALRWIAACDQLARRAVVLADLARSRVAMAGAWLACLGLGMSRVTRHDAVVSLQRGYTREEFSGMLRDAGVSAVARRWRGFRIVAAWAPAERVG